MRSDAWCEGKSAYYAGDDIRDNPYHPCGEHGEDWTDGWIAGQKEDLE